MVRFVSLLLVSLCSLPALLAADVGTAEGTLTINGKAIKLTHVYATVGPADRGEKIYRVLLSDVAISDKDLALFPDSVIKQINDGKLHAIRLTLLNDKSLDAADIFNASDSPTIKEQNRLDIKTFNDKTIAGRLHLPSVYNDGITKFNYDVRFSAPLRNEEDLKQ